MENCTDFIYFSPYILLYYKSEGRSVCEIDEKDHGGLEGGQLMEKLRGFLWRMGKFSSAKDTLGLRNDPFPSSLSLTLSASTLLFNSNDLSNPTFLPCYTMDRWACSISLAFIYLLPIYSSL